MVKVHLFSILFVGCFCIPSLVVAGEEGSNAPQKTETKKKETDKKETREGADSQGKGSENSATPAQSEGKEKSEASSSPPAASSADDREKNGAYTVRLRDLEDRINRLKEQIFRTKARLSLLAESVLDKKIAGAKARVIFKNEMGGSFRLVKAVFLLDGGPIYNKSDEDGSLAERDEIDVFEGPVMPGEHTLSVVLHYRGHGYGIFSYLRGYSFKTRSSRTFSINEGKALKLEVVGYEKGTATTPLEERPDVRYVMDVSDFDEEAVSEQDGEEKE